jgi:predicted DCC family thiol-disulfide oxidoreductase YuxK
VRTSWTGGQYSLLRVLLAAACAYRLGAFQPNALVLLVGLGLTALLAAGAWARFAALALAVIVRATDPNWIVDGHWSLASLTLVGLLVLHTALPRAPYGSWEARGRADPDGDWTMPAWAPLVAWIAIVSLHVWIVLAGSAPTGVLLPTLLVAVLALRTATRPFAWTIAAALSLFGPLGSLPAPIIVLLAYAFDPGWIRASRGITPAIVFYDGACGLCHRIVRFILAEDRQAVFRLAPLQGRFFEQTVGAAMRESLPDSIVVRTADGRLLSRARGSIEIGAALGGIWRLLSMIAACLPQRLADGAYDRIAAARRGLFAPPATTCPLVPPALRARFIDEEGPPALRLGGAPADRPGLSGPDPGTAHR